MLDYTRPAAYPRGEFVTVPTAALTLPPNALKVLLLALNWNPAAHRGFTQAAVVRRCPELGRDAVRSAFARLEAEGLFTRRAGVRGSTVYTLHAWPASDEATSDRPPASDGSASAASDEPTPNTPEELSQNPLPSPVAEPAAPTVHPPQEEGDVVQSEPSGRPPVEVWVGALIAALPAAVRPATVPARLYQAAAPWLGWDPQLVAEVIAASVPPRVHSPAGLLISKLGGGLSVAQLEHARQRREFAARRRAAVLADAGEPDAAARPAASSFAAAIRAQLPARAVTR